MSDSEDRALLDADFFARDPRDAARELLGCLLVCESDDGQTGGVIVETEAYLGSDDPGSHAATKGITRRNAVMYGPPGGVYVYFTYGAHHMVNLVCGPVGTAGAVLLRAIEPTLGVELMARRRPGRSGRELCSGPGKLAQALGVDLGDNGTMLGSGRIRVYAGERRAPGEVATSGRIGLAEGHELEYRYFLKDSHYISRAAPGPVRRGASRGRS